MTLEQLQALARRCRKPVPDAFVGEQRCSTNSSWVGIRTCAVSNNIVYRYVGSCSTLIAPIGDFLTVVPA